MTRSALQTPGGLTTLRVSCRHLPGQVRPISWLHSYLPWRSYQRHPARPTAATRVRQHATNHGQSRRETGSSLVQ